MDQDTYILLRKIARETLAPRRAGFPTLCRWAVEGVDCYDGPVKLKVWEIDEEWYTTCDAIQSFIDALAENDKRVVLEE